MAVTREQCAHSPAFRDRSERGSSLLGILSVVGVLGILATIVVTVNLGTSTSPTTTVTSAATRTTSPTTTAPQSVASGASEATVAACEANFVTISTALSAYETLNGIDPPAGTSWATSSANGGPLLQSWPTGPTYRLVWNGQVLSVIPTKGVPSRGSAGEGLDRSGCFATE